MSRYRSVGAGGGRDIILPELYMSSHLWRVDFSSLTLWTGPFPAEGVFGYCFIMTMFYRNQCI